MTYYLLGQTQTGDDKTKSFDQSLTFYQKSAEMKPTEAGYYIQMGNIYAAEKKMPEAEQALNKAVQLDPSIAGKAYYNLGANLVNTGHADQAAEYFKKSTDANPNNPEAWYQLGLALAGKGSVDVKTGETTYPPGTAEAYQQYLKLQPNGPHAAEAQAMLQAINETVQTKTVVKKH
jgi:tetratricopeptide (TPR) repeat protein